MNSPQALAQMIRGANDSLAKAASELGDKITWRPLDKGRSALDQVQECTGIALFGAKIFTDHAVPPFDRSAFEQLRAEHNTPEKAFAALQNATNDCARAVEAFPAEKLGDKIMLPFRGGLEKSFAETALMVYWNATYHEGQVNYIQTLCAPDEPAA